MNRKIIYAVVVLIVVLGLYLPRLLVRLPVTVAAARTGTIQTWVEERAQTSLPRTYVVTTPLNGRVLAIDLEEGDEVKEGQVLARLEAADFEADLAAAEADVASLASELDLNARQTFEDLVLEEYGKFLEAYDKMVEASQEKQKASAARVEYAGKALASQVESYEKQATSAIEVWRAQLVKAESDVGLTNDRLITSALLAFRSAIVLLPKYVDENNVRKSLQRKALEAKQRGAKALAARAQRDRGRIEIKSPVSGVVLARHHSEERFLPAGTLLLEIGRREDLRVTTDVLTHEAVAIQADHKVEITGKGTDFKPLTGTVLRVKPRAFTKISSLGVEQQRVDVEVAFGASPPVAELALGVGYRVRVRIFTGSRDGALTVPRRALVRGLGGTWHVFAAEGGTARRYEVTLGLQNDDEVEILSGLEAGATVILSPPSSLEDGQRISAET